MGESLSDQDRGRIGILRASSTSSGSLAGGSVSRLNSRRRSEARNLNFKRDTHDLKRRESRRARTPYHQIAIGNSSR